MIEEDVILKELEDLDFKIIRSEFEPRKFRVEMNFDFGMSASESSVYSVLKDISMRHRFQTIYDDVSLGVKGMDIVWMGYQK